ncbi:phosphate ABC transporter substrate-binding protein PstS family protein [Clostridium oceanicum]|uniref:Phosphate-binding protein n=1 Tax=Clostridium oceanicum TaxID=1543 RepID=A0ABP3UI34_9CLOT
MKRKGLKLLVSALAITLTMGVLAGCGNKEEAKKEETNKNAISGTITSLGSSALQPLAEQAAKNFREKNPDATINVQGGGSGAGVKQVSSGAVEIGNSDVEAKEKLKDESKVKELVDHKVCGIGFAVVVNKDVKVDNLTKKQIQDIFTGKVTNWKDIGGQDEKINVVNRSKSSGTRATFKNTVMEGKDEKEGLGTTQDSSGSVEKAISQTKGAISYLAMSYITEEKKENLKVLKVDGVEANKENITAKKYPFWSYEHMYTKGEPKGLTKAFLDYMVSDDNKALVEKLGYIPMGDLK